MDVDELASPYGRPAALPGVFTETYRCQPARLLPHGNPLRETLDYCGKVILPQSALEQLSRYSVEYPMVFRVANARTGTASHCGVLEFSAREGQAFVPGWLMETLALEAGDFVTVSNAVLPRGALIKIQPQSPAFLDITDPRAVLEFTLRQFTTLSPGDCFWINYLDEVHRVRVLSTEPGATGILVVETDLNVDFAPPVGYQEPSARAGKSVAGSVVRTGRSLEGVFAGAPKSLRDQSSVGSTGSTGSAGSAGSAGLAGSGGPAPIKVPKNTVFFASAPKAASPTQPASAPDQQQPFQGASGSLRG